MLDPVALLTDAVVHRVVAAYEELYPGREAAYTGLLENESRIALSEISRSDALYHDVHHTAMVTDAGLVILNGRSLNGEPVAVSSDQGFVALAALRSLAPASRYRHGRRRMSG